MENQYKSINFSMHNESMSGSTAAPKSFGKAFKILLKHQSETLDALNNESTQNAYVNENYVWANTDQRRTKFDLEQSLERLAQFSNNGDIELIHAISSMLENNLIKENFTILDLFGGTGAVSYIIKKSFPKCVSICLDMKYHNNWAEIQSIYSASDDFHFFQINFFELEKESKPLNLDIITTFNTFRGWDNAVGPLVQHKYTKSKFMNWVKNNSRYFITDRGDVEKYLELLPFDSPFNNLKVAFSK